LRNKNRNKKQSFATKKLLSFIFSSRKLIISVVLLLFFAIGMGQFTPYLTKFIVNNLASGEPASTCIFFGIATGVLLIIEAVCIFIQARILGALGNRVANEIRQEALSNITKFPLSNFETKPIGSILVKTTTYANEVGNFFSIYLCSFTINSIKLLAIFAFMLSLNFKMGLIALGFVIIIVLVTKLVGVLIKKRNMVYKQADMEKCELLFESIKGLKTIIANNRKTKNLEMFRGTLTRANIAYNRFSKVNELLSPLVDFIWYTALVSVYLFSFWLVQSGVNVEVGVVVAFLGYMSQATLPISETGIVFRNLAIAFGALDKIYDKETLLLLSIRTDPKKQLEILGETPSIVYKKVFFNNKNNSEILNNISFEIPYGEKVLLTGPSGSGKTSIVKTLIGQYPIESGMILIDDKLVDKISEDNLFKNIGILTNENFLFKDTILENIRVGNPSATEEECLKAAKIAGIDIFASKLKEGFSTVVGESKEYLSEGEKLLLGFARLILQNPKIIVLDEAIDPLDSRQEQKFLKSFNKIFADRTIIYVDVAKKDGYIYNKQIKIDSGVIVNINTENQN